MAGKLTDCSHTNVFGKCCSVNLFDILCGFFKNGRFVFDWRGPQWSNAFSSRRVQRIIRGTSQTVRWNRGLGGRYIEGMGQLAAGILYLPVGCLQVTDRIPLMPCSYQENALFLLFICACILIKKALKPCCSNMLMRWIGGYIYVFIFFH